MKKILLLLGVSFLIVIVFFVKHLSEETCYFDDFNECKLKAEKGNPEAQFRIGLAYVFGNVFEEDDLINVREGIKWITKSANNNYDPVSQYFLGYIYEYGVYDYKRSYMWYRKVADQEYSAMKSPYPRLYYGGNNTRYIIRTLGNDLNAVTKIGVMSLYGTGTDQDFKESIKWFRRGIIKDFPNAQFYLGVMYKHGYGVDQDYKEAVKWFRKSAEQGFDRGEYSLGVMYKYGYGVTQDDRESEKWFRKSVKQFRELSEKGSAESQYHLGVMYENGFGVPQSFEEAIKWYTKSAEKEDEESQYRLGLLYEKGQGVPQNYVMAYMYFNVAVVTGYEGAVNNRDKIAVKMTDLQIEKAEELVMEWEKTHHKFSQKLSEVSL